MRLDIYGMFVISVVVPRGGPSKGRHRIGVTTLFIEPGSPWENGYCESFNSKLRDELLAGEQFSTLHEAKGADRALATALQRRAASLLARLSPAGTRDDLATSVCSALRYAPARSDAGQQRPDSNLIPGIAAWGRPGPADRRSRRST